MTVTQSPSSVKRLDSGAYGRFYQIEGVAASTRLANKLNIAAAPENRDIRSGECNRNYVPLPRANLPALGARSDLGESLAECSLVNYHGLLMNPTRLRFLSRVSVPRDDSAQGLAVWRPVLALLAILGLLLTAPPTSSAEEPPIDQRTIPQQVDKLLTQLDEPTYEARQRAAAELAKLTADKDLAAVLAERFRRLLTAEGTSFEVRARLAELLRKLPVPSAADDVAAPSVEAIAPLIALLNSDLHAERDGAQQRLLALVQHKPLIIPVLKAAKAGVANPESSTSVRRLLAPITERAHEAWLRTDLSGEELPKPSAEQINIWIDDAVRIESADDVESASRKPSESELLDLIARDDTRDGTLAMLRERVERETDEAVVQKLNYLLDFARPGMAAEGWNNHTNVVIQFLLIGVPQYNDAISPPRATHFDRIDSQTAHCVSGNSLTEGDYPVRVGIPHPEPVRDSLFYLTNLPTPRSRLAYEYWLKRDGGSRLAEITQRTLEYFITRQTPLSEVEILMLAQLEPRAVSKFVGRYFTAVPDANLVSTPNGLNGLTSVHGGICLLMSRVGTQEAVPAIEKLARSGALGKPKYPNRVDVAWVALLAIANRDPWPEIDPWLAGLIDEKIPLTTDPQSPPELGASAAGLLLDRHDVSVQPFGIVPAGEALSDVYQFFGFRFSSRRRPRERETLVAKAAGDESDSPTGCRSAPSGRSVGSL